MKKHRVLFLDGPVAGQKAMLNPHETKILVVHATDGNGKVLAVVRQDVRIGISITDEGLMATSYTISELKGDEHFWYVATRATGDKDHVLAILIGKAEGTGYYSGSRIAERLWSQ